MNANATAAVQLMQVIGLNDPKATEMTFRFPTLLTKQALKMLVSQYSEWIELKTRQRGTFILQWILGNDNPITKNHAYIRSLKARIAEFEHHKEGLSRTKQIWHGFNENSARALRDQISTMQRRQRRQRTMQRRQIDHATLRQKVPKIEKALPKTALRDMLIAAISEGRNYGTDLDVEVGVSLAWDAHNSFVPMSWEEFRLKEIRELKLLLMQTEEKKKALQQEYRKVKQSVRRFLKDIVAMETCEGAASNA